MSNVTKYRKSGKPGQYSAASFTPDGSTALMAKEWVERAACRTVDVDLFFPVGSGENGGSPAHAYQYEEARKVCSRCEVSSECLDAVMEAERGVSVRYGLFAGLSPVQRKALASETSKWQKQERRKPTF